MFIDLFNSHGWMIDDNRTWKPYLKNVFSFYLENDIREKRISEAETSDNETRKKLRKTLRDSSAEMPKRWVR